METEDDLLNFTSQGDLTILKNVSDATNYLQYKMLMQQMYRGAQPFICAIGIFGNCMGMYLIQTNESLTRLASSTFLTVLAACSSLFLAILFCSWLEAVTDTFNIFNQNPAGCKLFEYLAHCCDFLCVWLIVAVCADRFMVLHLPDKRTKYCTHGIVKRITLFAIVITLFSHAWLLVMAEPEQLGKRVACGVPAKYHTAYDTMNILETIFGLVIPCLLVFVLNIFVIGKIRAHAAYTMTPQVRFSKLPTSEQIVMHRTAETGLAFSATNNNNNTTNFNNTFYSMRSPDNPPLPLCSQSETPAPSESVANGNSAVSLHSKKGRIRAADVRLTRSLLLITSIFVILNVPSYLTRLFFPASSAQPSLWQVGTIMLSYLMYYSHHAVLFYIYIFNSAQMRKHLKPTALKLIECYCLKTVPDFGHT